MKKITVILLTLALLFTFVACNNDPKPDSDNEDKPVAADIKVGLLIPGSPTDGGWSQSGVEALNGLKERTGATTTVIEAPNADQMKTEAENLADAGYQVIIGHGGQYASPFAEICDQYPDAIFVTMGGSVVRDNLYPVQAKLEDPAYIAGVISAMVSETGKIGLLVGGDFPSYTKTTRGFSLGAQSINPDIEVMHAVLSTIDMNEAYETTLNQIDSGADVVWANANQATLGSLKAAVEKDVYCFGAQLVQTDEAPENLIASLTQDFSYIYQAIFDRYADGTIEPGIQEVGIDENAVGFVWNEQVKSTLPEEVQEVYDIYAPKVISDEIDVPGEND